MKYNFSISILFIFTFVVLFNGVMAHMNVHTPFPRTYKLNPYSTKIDYDIAAPLNSASKPFPCAGNPKSQSVLTVKPGDSIKVQIEGGAPHNGGHCEFSLSYDGQKFVSLQTIIRECLRASGTSFSIPLPPNVPGGPAVFSWTWVNSDGNREFYMNCMDITIDAPATGSLSGPPIVVANLPGYPTIPEMMNGADDMRSLYANRQNIQVSPGDSCDSVTTKNPDSTSTIIKSTQTTTRTTTGSIPTETITDSTNQPPITTSVSPSTTATMPSDDCETPTPTSTQVLPLQTQPADECDSSSDSDDDEEEEVPEVATQTTIQPTYLSPYVRSLTTFSDVDCETGTPESPNDIIVTEQPFSTSSTFATPTTTISVLPTSTSTFATPTTTISVLPTSTSTFATPTTTISVLPTSTMEDECPA